MYIDTLYDAAPPSAEPGLTFTANQGPNVLAAKGAYLDHFEMSLFADVGTATVFETAINFMTQFTFKAGQETRIQLGFNDLVALMAAFYKENPKASVDGSSNSVFCFAVKIPVQEVIQQGTTYTWAANYTAVTNVTVNKMVLQAVYYNAAPANAKPVIVVPTSWTTPGSTGVTSINARFQNLGDMIGLIVYNTTQIGSASDVADIQRIQLVENGKQTSLLSAANGERLVGTGVYGSSDPLSELLHPYDFWNFSAEPLNVADGYVELQADVETASEATRIIPIILKR